MISDYIQSTESAEDSISPLRARREAAIDQFRIHGQLPADDMATLEKELAAIVTGADGELHAMGLFELATVQRVSGRFETAIQTYKQAAAAAEALADKELLFDAWMAIARSHAYGTRNHGAAAKAFRQAEASAGEQASVKQRYEMAGYASQLQAGRGELEAALINAIEAISLAQDNSQRFYAQLDTGSVLQKFGESCDYRKLVDAKTASDGDDTWGACRRAIDSAAAYYEDARESARKMGWDALRTQAEEFIRALDTRRMLIEKRVEFEKIGTVGIFKAQDVSDVLVNEDFAAGASTRPDLVALAELIDMVVPEGQDLDPRSLYLLGIKADLEQKPEVALQYFERAVDLLQTERASWLDIRKRGTVVENRPEIARDLALRLLALEKWDAAFAAFESMRARGMSELAAALERGGFTAAERQWLARLVEAESQQSALRSDLVETAIAGIAHSKSVAKLEQLRHLAKHRQELVEEPAFRRSAERLGAAAYKLPRLSEVEALVGKTDIPVVFYWVTPTNVLVWIVSPEGSLVKTVFLPEAAVIDKVTKLVRSVRSDQDAFDSDTARELHTYLLKPFARYLSGPQMLIVPQGPLVTLPFEALIDAETGRFIIEDTALSYAPNAAFALRALAQPVPTVSAITAIYDQELERNTGEVSRLEKAHAFEVSARPSQTLSAETAMELLGASESVHVLLHGIFETRDPLQSRLTLNNLTLSREDNQLTAAELLAVDWRDTRLAVFSSCEGAMVNTRISNEVYGLSWAPLVGGAKHVLLSRWRVSSDSNAEWMATFYEAVASGQASPALAAATAMRRLLASERRAPFYWAGPQVFGR